MEIDYQLVGEGVKVTDDYFSMIMDGTFHSVAAEQAHEDEGETHEYMSPLPYHQDGRGPAQVMISDYTLNSLINASLDLQWYDLTKVMNGDSINMYIRGFAEAFGSFTDVTIVAKPVKGTQKVALEGGKYGVAKFTGLVNMHILNPFADREMDVAVLTVEITASAQIDIRTDYKLTGEVMDLTTDIKEFEAYFHTTTTKEGLDAQLAFLDPWASSYFNNML